MIDFLNIFQASFCASTEHSTVTKVWKPALYIFKLVNMKILKAHERAELLWVTKSNTTNRVTHFTENEITFACPMKFNRYPFDEQDCELLMMDIRSPSDETLKLQNEYMLLGYEGIRDFHPTVRDYDYVLEPSPRKGYYEGAPGTGYNVSTTGFKLKMKRNYFRYFIMYFIPTSKYC